MYIVLLIIVLGAGIFLAAMGQRQGQRSILSLGIGLFVGGALFFFALLPFWGELYWFQSLGYGERFWTVVWARTFCVLGGGLVGLLGVAALTGAIRFRPAPLRVIPPLVGAGIGMAWGWNRWDEIMLFLNRVSTELREPILGQDTGFYFFILPFLDGLFWLALWISGIGLLAALASLLDWSRDPIRPRGLREKNTTASLPVVWTAAVLAVVLAAGFILNGFHLLYSSWGVVTGPGWTDVQVRLPAYGIVALIMVLLGCAPLLPGVRRWLQRRLGGATLLGSSDLASLGAVWIGIIASWILMLGIVPSLVQALVVEPNEITFETPYIEHNIRFTRHGFKLHQVEEKHFPATETLTRQAIEENQPLLSNVRLWDWRALDAVYEQFQEIRLYYEFRDVDIDRYNLGDNYRQVMVSARELNLSNLPDQSQTFVNKRFKFTHGYGLTLTTVNDFTEQGLPRLLIKDIPPQVTVPSLKVTHPQIYYGELTREPAVVNTQEQEFDYPSGDQNVYIRYPGNGGVELSNLWRKFIYGWMFDGTRFLLSTYPTPESRFMFRRQIRERASALAPFLTLDEDPYIVLADGRLYWIIDAYTTSRYYPYSESFSAAEDIRYRQGQRPRQLEEGVANSLDGMNYVRNAVKVVIDAFEGTTDFYVFDPEDPLIQAWQGVFPDLFKSREQMPAALEAHVRYPAGLLLAQGLVYAKYHMDNPEVFYNQEDLWVRATEKYYNQVQPVEPYYIMWQLPEAEQVEFVLMLPFTPKNRQVLIGWIAGLSDGENYGRFLAYKFPKEKRILGPQQVETKIDQDRFLSGQLTLWDQRGSNVIRGNVLAIPIEDTLLYVEPIYLQAETAAYPELRLVVVMHEDTLSYADSFDKALEGLFEDIPQQETGVTVEGSLQELAQQANEAFKTYLRLQSERRFEAAGQQLQTLSELLQRLVGPENGETAVPGIEREE